MDAEAIVTVSATVVAMTQLAKWSGLRDGWAPAGVLLLSALGVALWGWSHGVETTPFDYLAGLVAVMTSAAGVFGFTRAAGDRLTALRGGGES